MTKADKLRELFPTYIGSPSIEIYEDDDALKVVTYLNIPENRIETMWTIWDEGKGGWYNGEFEGATLDNAEDGINGLDDEEFKLLVQGLRKSKDLLKNLH